MLHIFYFVVCLFSGSRIAKRNREYENTIGGEYPALPKSHAIHGFTEYSACNLLILVNESDEETYSSQTSMLTESSNSGTDLGSTTCTSETMALDLCLPNRTSKTN